VQSFADERCGRAGVVYQASNFDFIGSHESTFYELDGEWYHEITMNAIKRGGQRGVYLRANKERAVVHKFNQYRYIRFLNKRARKRLNTKLFKVQPYPK
ncbi:protein mom, partial [Escherichia coli]|nr:protein mom [Escherichia coli]